MPLFLKKLEGKRKMSVRELFVVTGKIHSGKTSLLKNLANLLKGKGISISGILSQSIRNKSNEITGYDLMDLKTGEIHPFLRTDLSGEIPVGRFFLSRKNLREAKKIFEGTGGDVVFLDEFGVLESKEQGLFPSFCSMIERGIPILIITVRGSLLKRFIEIKEERFREIPLTIYRVEDGANPLFLRILEIFKENERLLKPM